MSALPKSSIFQGCSTMRVFDAYFCLQTVKLIFQVSKFLDLSPFDDINPNHSSASLDSNFENVIKTRRAVRRQASSRHDCHPYTHQWLRDLERLLKESSLPRSSLLNALSEICYFVNCVYDTLIILYTRPSSSAVCIALRMRSPADLTLLLCL